MILLIAVISEYRVGWDKMAVTLTCGDSTIQVSPDHCRKG